MKHRNAVVGLFMAFLWLYTDALQAQSGDRWSFRDTVDQMTDTKGFEADLHARAADHGRSGTVEVTATCAAEVVKLDVVYASDTDKKLGFQQAQPNRVNMRIRIDDAPVRTISAQSDYVNEAELFFSEISPGQAMGDMRGPSGSRDVTPLLRLFASAESAGTIDDLYGAHLVRLELPLANGDAPVLRITPRDDPEFQRFAARCKAEHPMVRKTFISGGPAFSSALPPGITAVLGDHRLIPLAGARFVPVTEDEAREIVVAQARGWYASCPAKDGKDYAPAFKSAAILPGRTVCSAVESDKPRFIVAAPGQNPRELNLVGRSVGRGGVTLVKVADGRFGLIPTSDLFSGYTDYAKRMPDPLQQAAPERPACDLAPEDRTFNGTAEQFAAAFPDFLKRAAAGWHLDPQSFAPESAYIVDLARTCAQITPEMLDSVRNPANDDIDLQKLANGKFRKCDSMNTYVTQAARNLPTPQAFDGRGIELAGPRRPSHWLDGESFTLRVKFSRLRSDPYDASHPYPADFWIVEATIRSSAAAPQVSGPHKRF